MIITKEFYPMRRFGLDVPRLVVQALQRVMQVFLYPCP